VQWLVACCCAGRLADREIQVLLSTDLAMLPAGHQMMERLRVRHQCGLLIRMLLRIRCQLVERVSGQAS
jgi:hypothetical protein